VAVLSAVFMLLTEKPVMADIINCWLPIGYAGILSTGVAYSLQILGQKHLEPTPAALIMSLESVFAVLSGWLVLHEQMSAAEYAGCALVFLAVILSQFPIKKAPS
jgi:drug/metabolite transporter (DMT)-like permease